MPRKRIWTSKWHTKTKKKKLAIYRVWPWISNCWEWDLNSGFSGLESSALTTRPRRLGANLRRNATSRLLFLNQSVLADFDPRKKKDSHFKTRSLSGTSKDVPVFLSSLRMMFKRNQLFAVQHRVFISRASKYNTISGEAMGREWGVGRENFRPVCQVFSPCL